MVKQVNKQKLRDAHKAKRDGKTNCKVTKDEELLSGTWERVN